MDLETPNDPENNALFIRYDLSDESGRGELVSSKGKAETEVLDLRYALANATLASVELGLPLRLIQVLNDVENSLHEFVEISLDYKPQRMGFLSNIESVDTQSLLDVLKNARRQLRILSRNDSSEADDDPAIKRLASTAQANLEAFLLQATFIAEDGKLPPAKTPDFFDLCRSFRHQFFDLEMQLRGSLEAYEESAEELDEAADGDEPA